jgi:O-acetyl-ADP-ribose deacetylase (regulator of RNase III)
MEPEMANPFSLSNKPRAGALADAAERLGRVASVVKDQQIARNQSGVRAPEGDVFTLSPEEAWTRKYMIQCVGPVCTIQPTEAAALLLPRFAPAAAAKQAPQNVEIAPQKQPEPLVAAPARSGRKAAMEPIGLAIGKPVRKRSLIGRLFRR